MMYHIRPKDVKHPVLLPVGEQAQFRLDKDKLVLLVESLDSKERQYIVVSMTPRADRPRMRLRPGRAICSKSVDKPFF